MKKAKAAIEKACKINKKYSGIYLLEAEMLERGGGGGGIGEACSRYENAIVFDPNDKLASLKLAQIYKDIYVEEALSYLKQLFSIDSEYIPAYAPIGDHLSSEGYVSPIIGSL